MGPNLTLSLGLGGVLVFRYMPVQRPVWVKRWGHPRVLKFGLTSASVLALLAAGSAVSEEKQGRALKQTPLALGAEGMTIDLTQPVKTFRPTEAFGAGLDGTWGGNLKRIYTRHNLEKMRSANLRRVTYRLKTELGIMAWHWNPEGSWSDPKNQQGYWTSSDKPTKSPILMSYGYDLPRRGHTYDNANNKGYSRLSDGDVTSLWKSNPYLDESYTHDPVTNTEWAVIELDQWHPINAVKILWADPYATDFEVQYWTGEHEYVPGVEWTPFKNGVITGAKGGEMTLKLADAPENTKFIRIRMTKSSHTPLHGGADRRDALGYAIYELYAGTIGADGVFQDVMKHAKVNKDQTRMWVSSTDPWHQEADKELDLEQPGIDLIYRSKITNGLPVMFPVGAYYDTPENGAALIRYLKAKRYRVDMIELGEEPDGQNIPASHYGALYIQLADAVRKENPKLKLGGPSNQNGIADTWLDGNRDQSWVSQFTRYLKKRDRLKDLQFFSFERYPFDDICGSLEELQLQQIEMMDDLFGRLRRDGVPTDIPWIITEYGYSAFSGRAMSEPSAAVFNADIVAGFLSRGGHSAYLFGYNPNWPANQFRPCAGWGNMMLFQADPEGQAAWPMPPYHGAVMMTKDWAQLGSGQHKMFAVHGGPKDKMGREIVSAYAVRRPDGRLAVMFTNHSATETYRLKLNVTKKGALTVADARPWTARRGFDLVQYGAEQYTWEDKGEESKPIKNLPPKRTRLKPGPVEISLPPISMSVLRAR